MQSKFEEKTFILIKPEGIQRGKIGDIIILFEKRGYKLIALKMLRCSSLQLEMYFYDHKDN